MKKVLFTILLSVIFFDAFLAKCERSFIVDRVVLVIDGEPLTEYDFKTFSLALGMPEGDVCNILDKIVEIFVVNNEFRGENIDVGAEDIAKEEERIIKKLGGVDVLNYYKKIYGVNSDVLREKISFIVKYRKALSIYLEERVSVKFDEVKKYYDTVYLKKQKALSIKPLPFPEVFSVMEKILKQRKLNEIKKDWLYKIKKKHEIYYILGCRKWKK